MRTHVNKIETLYGRSRVYVKVEPRSTFTFTRGLSYITSISFTHVNFTCVRTEKIRDGGNQPLSPSQFVNFVNFVRIHGNVHLRVACITDGI